MAYFEKDWFMRQLKLCVDMAASMILGKEFSPYQLSSQDPTTPADQLHVRIVTLLNQGDTNGAEDVLFDSVDPEDMDIYHVGLDFYDRLNQMTDRELAEVDFSREEIREGLADFSAEYGCDGLFDELNLSWPES